jgi:hypothetical protein
MPDIREVLASLDENDKLLWTQHRVEMRRSFITAHNSVLGLASWDASDDMMMDYIDIKLALLFDRAGRMEAVKPTAKLEDAKVIEEKVAEVEDAMKAKIRTNYSPATEALKNANGGWN